MTGIQPGAAAPGPCNGLNMIFCGDKDGPAVTFLDNCLEAGKIEAELVGCDAGEAAGGGQRGGAPRPEDEQIGDDSSTYRVWRANFKAYVAAYKVGLTQDQRNILAALGDEAPNKELKYLGAPGPNEELRDALYANYSDLFTDLYNGGNGYEYMDEPAANEAIVLYFNSRVDLCLALADLATTEAELQQQAVAAAAGGQAAAEELQARVAQIQARRTGMVEEAKKEDVIAHGEERGDGEELSGEELFALNKIITKQRSVQRERNVLTVGIIIAGGAIAYTTGAGQAAGGVVQAAIQYVSGTLETMFISMGWLRPQCRDDFVTAVRWAAYHSGLAAPGTQLCSQIEAVNGSTIL